MKLGALAACLVIVISATFALPKILDKNNSKTNQNTDSIANDNSKGIANPAIELPDLSDGMKADMIGLIVYQGHIYTQSQFNTDAEAEALKGIVGEYLGNAKGNIDEWSTQDEYATEFAATISGKVYSVKGYTTDFRICTYEEYEGHAYLQFFDNFNGITITTGKDIFGDRLNIKDNFASVTYLDDQTWNNAVNNNTVYHELSNISQSNIDAFVDALYSSEFLDKGNSDIYDEAKGHLFFKMKDGTRIELRLAKGGYVGLQSFGWYFVKMPSEVFDPIYNSIQ